MQQNIQHEAQEHIRKFRAFHAEMLALAKESDLLATSDPQKLKKKIRIWILLGYGFLGLLLLGSIAAIAAMAYFSFSTGKFHFLEGKLLFFLVVLVYAILKGFFIKIPPPDGLRLSKESAPRIWGMVERMCNTLNAPIPTEIVITEEANASAAVVPKFGFFGPKRASLILGVPLMAGFSSKQMQAVIAHELGHFAGNHNNFSLRVYSIVQALGRTAEQSNASPVGKFMEWYFPRLEAHTFGIRRAHEFEADAAAAKLLGPEVTASALARTKVLSYLDQNFLPAFWSNLSYDNVEIPPDIQSRIHLSYKEDMDKEAKLNLFEWDRQREPQFDDSHPTMYDRIERLIGINLAIDEVAELAKAPNTSFLEEYADEIPNQVFNIDPGVKQRWDELQQFLSEQRSEISRILEQSKTKPLNRDEKIGLIRARTHVGENTISVLREFLREYPSEPDALRMLGTQLLDQNDPEGEEVLKSYRELCPRDSQNVAQAIGDYRARNFIDDSEDLAQMMAEGGIHGSQMRTLIENSSHTDSYLPLTLTPAERDRLHGELKTLSGIGTAYAVSRSLPNGENVSLLIILPSALTMNERFQARAFQHPISFNGLIFVPNTAIGKWNTKLDRVEGAKVY